MKKFKKIVSLMLAAAMSFTLVVSQAVTAAAASADSEKVSAARVWSGKVDTSWFTKDKTKDVYNISTAEQLAGLSKLVTENAQGNYFKGVMINLTNDIVLNDTSGWENWKTNPPKNKWEPMGYIGGAINGYRSFSGVFNGNGHTISGMYVDDKIPEGLFSIHANGGGLFAYISGAAIIDLKIEKSVVSSEDVAAGLVAECENSYIDGVEVNDVKIYSTINCTAGGIVGVMRRVNLALPLMYTTLLAFGVALNPLYFNEEGGLVTNSCAVNCKVVNTDIYVEWDTTPAGMIVGDIMFRGGVYNSICVNCSIHAARDVYRNSIANFGSLCGNFAEDSLDTKNCYSYGLSIYTKKGKVENPARKDESRVKSISKKTLQSSDFAKKLGDKFKYVKNGTPILSTINRYKVKVVLNGSNAKLSWTSVKNAKEYKVYYKSNGVYKEITTVKTTNAKLKNIKKGSTYSLLIRAFYSDGTYEDVDSGKFTLKA